MPLPPGEVDERGYGTCRNQTCPLRGKLVEAWRNNQQVSPLHETGLCFHCCPMSGNVDCSDCVYVDLETGEDFDWDD